MKHFSCFLSLIIFLFVVIGVEVHAQDIPKHISYTRIYDFLDEMAGDGWVELNSAVKPYSQQFITDKLLEVKLQVSSLNNRQKKDLDFFLNELALEQNTLPDTHFDIWKNNHSRAGLIAPAYSFKDSTFRARINPLLGMHISQNGNGSITKRWYGADLQLMMGNNLSVYGSLRDNSIEGALLSRPHYLTDLPGYEYKESSAGGDYSDSRGGIKYAWQWGSVGLIKDNVVWGDNYHGANILSGRAPSFPMLTLHLTPSKWFELNYFHGWLVSNVVDSTRYYVDNVGAEKYRSANKFMAANMFTFTPVAKLKLSVGNSIIYAEPNVQPAYLIPIAFYKSMDHTLTKGALLENQNSQVFFNLSSRNIKHLHLYGSVYADEVMMSRFSPSSAEKNPISYKVGANVTNFPLHNVSFVGEFTRNSIIVYKHSIPVLAYTSNNYNLGNYLGDNSQEFYLAMLYKPLRGLNLSLSYTDAVHGNEYEYLRRDNDGVDAISRIIRQPLLGETTWHNTTLAFNTQYELFTNAYAVVNVTYNNMRGSVPSSVAIPGELRKSSQEYLDYYSSKFLQGKNTTVTIGFSLGF